MLGVARKILCAEDFEPWDTNVRKDFLCTWYHNRSKKVKTVSRKECMEDEDSGINTSPDLAGDFAEQVVGENFCQWFKAALSPKDMAILELRGSVRLSGDSGQAWVQDSQRGCQADGGHRLIQCEEEAGR